MEATGAFKFTDYRDRLMRFYNEKRYREALDVAVEASSQFPMYDAKTSFWIACLQSRLGEQDEAVLTLQHAVARKIWWPVEVFQDPDLDTVRERPEFRKVLEECDRLKHEEQSKGYAPELLVREPAAGPEKSGWPAFIAFHQRYGEHPELSSVPWESVLSRGMLLAAPWSSQLHAVDGRCWDNVAVGEKDVKWAFSSLRSRYSINPSKIVLGGFSQGGALSIYAALKKLVPSQGFVAVAPSDWIAPERRAFDRAGPSKEFRSFLETVDCRGFRGVIIIGEKDPFLPKIELLHHIMAERGLEGKFIIEPGLGHEYPEGFETKLGSAIDFVLGRTKD